MYCQKDYPQLLGTGNSTIAQAGCFLTSFCNLAEYYGETIDPPTLNTQMSLNGGFVNGDILVSSVAASLINFSPSESSDPCIGETYDNAKYGVPTHFFLLFADNTIVDPLDENPQRKPNTYNVVSRRYFTPNFNTHTVLIQDTIAFLGSAYAELNPTDQAKAHALADRLRALSVALGETNPS